MAALEQVVLTKLPADERSRTRARYHLEAGRFSHDIRPLLKEATDTVPEIRGDGASTAVARSQVSTLLRVFIAGWYSDRAPIAYRTGVLPAAWRGLLSRVTDCKDAKGGWRNGLLKLAHRAVSAGVETPEALPTEPNELDAWLRQQVSNPAELHSIRSALSNLVKAGIVDLPAFRALPRKNARKRLNLTPEAEDALLRSRVPGLAQHIVLWEAAVSSRDHADDTVKARRRAMKRIAAYVIASVDAGVITPEQAAAAPEMWWIMPAVGQTSVEKSFVDPAFTLAFQSGPSVIESVLFWAARTGLIGGIPQGRLQLPRSVLVDLRAFKATFGDRVAAAKAAGATLRPENEALYSQAWAAHGALVGRIVDDAAGAASHPKSRGKRAKVPLSRKNKVLAASLIQLPWVLAFWLPWYTLVVLPRTKARLAAVRDRIRCINKEVPTGRQWQPLEHPEERRALQQYRTELRRWFVLAALFADPVRLKNLHAARVGPCDSQAEVQIKAEWTPDGQLIRILRISSTFAGRDIARAKGNGKASLKQSWKAQRDWDWPQVVIDLQWAAEYFTAVWYPDLERRGLAEGLSPEQALLSGRFALITTDGGKHAGKTTEAPVPGGYSASGSVNHIFKAAARECLAAMDVKGEGLCPFTIPERASDLAKVAPFVVSPHIVRLVWTCCLMGVMEGRKLRSASSPNEYELHDPIHLLCRATTDDERTLREEYNATSDRVLQLLARDTDSWRHPGADARLLDYLVSPDLRPDFAALWTQRVQDESGRWIPQALMQPFRDRQQGRDVRIPPLRRKGVP